MNRMILVAFAAGVLLAVPAPAGAVLSAGSVVLPFGGTYPGADGARRVHRGADVACSAGAQAEALAAGEVTFVGRVPSVSGGTVLAVTVRSGDDLVTMLPLAETSVSDGAQVARGDALGIVAASGDSSSPGPHLHIGLRRSGVYLDPSPLLEVVPDGVSAEPAAEPCPVPDATPIGADVKPAPAEAAPSVGAAPLAPGVSLAPRAVTSGARGDRPENPTIPRVATAVTARTAQAQGGIAPGVTLPSAAEAAAPRAALLPDAPSLVGGVVSVARDIGSAPAGVAALVTAFVSMIVLLSKRGIERHIQSNPPVSDRFGSMLQHVRAGDTLCGLTSCSGLLPSQSRGRLAQRR